MIKKSKLVSLFKRLMPCSNVSFYIGFTRGHLSQSYQITALSKRHSALHTLCNQYTTLAFIRKCRILAQSVFSPHASSLCAEDQDVRICGKRDYQCAQEARANMELSLYAEAANQSTTNSRPSCRCLPGCSEISYAAKLSSSSLSDSFAAKERFTPLADHPVNATYFK